MVRPRTVYIVVRSRVRTELPEPGSCGPRPCNPEALPSSNSRLLESSKRDMLRLFRLPN